MVLLVCSDGRTPRGVRFLQSVLCASLLTLFAWSGAGSAEDELPERQTDTSDLSERVQILEERLEQANAEMDQLRRRLSAEVRQEAALYLDHRGVIGPAMTDRELRPLDTILRRHTVGASIRTEYQRWDNIVDVAPSDDRADYAETRFRASLGYALAGGIELDAELQQLMTQGGLLELSPTDDGRFMPPPAEASGLALTQSLHPDSPLEVLRAEIRLPSFNLLGRLAHVPVTAVVGRQQIEFDDGFLLGADRDGRGITYDALRLYGENGSGGRIDLFAGRAAVGASTVAANVEALADPGSDAAVKIAGFRGESRGLLPDTSMSLYYVRSLTDRVRVTDAGYVDAPSTELHTAGVHVGLELTTVARFDLQAATQWGRFGQRDVENAWAAHVEFEMAHPANRYRITLLAAHGTGASDSSGHHGGFTPVAQDPRTYDELGYLTLKNCSLWGIRYVHSPVAGCELGVSVVKASAPEVDGDSGMLLRGDTPGDGHDIGGFLSVHARFRLYDEDESYVRFAFVRFAPGDYLDSDAETADAFLMAIEASF